MRSEFQEAIFRCIREERCNIFVEAVAGSGKTTTLEDSCNQIVEINPNVNILMLAFNKLIAIELGSRMPIQAQCKTFNSFCNSLLKQFMGRTTLSTGKDSFLLADIMGVDLRSKDQTDRKKEFYKIKGAITKLIALYKALYPQPFDLADVALKYQVDIPNNEEFDDLFEATLQASIHHKSMIDFSDQIFLPAYNKAKMPKFDWVFVDEAQDLNPVQILIIDMLQKAGARICCVGDRHQAIYAFRGADAKAVDTLISTTNAKSLPLSVCYRCPKSIIELAQEMVPHIKARDNAPEGTILDWETEQFISDSKDSDFVMCRTTAPLVRRCMQLLRLGKKATVRGREIGKKLIDLVEKFEKLAMPEFFVALENYRQDQTAKLKAREKDAELIMLNDMVDTVICFAEEATSPQAIVSKIESIFTDDTTTGIQLSTIHKAKGLQFKRCFILRPDLLPHPMAKTEDSRIQEKNLEYVAYTRSEDTLVFVQPEKEEIKKG